MFVRQRPSSSLLLIGVLIAAVTRVSGFYMMVSHESLRLQQTPPALLCWVHAPDCFFVLCVSVYITAE